MAFDVKEYLENRKKNTENGNNTSSGGGGFDAQDYLIKRKLPKVGEYLNSSLKSWNEKNNSAINEFNTRFKENKYRGDASDWYTDFGSRINELRVDADNMKSLIEEYKDYLDEDFVSSVTKAFDSNSINYSQMVKLAADDKDYWSNWDTEDAYNAYMAEQKAQEEEQTKLLSYDLEGGKTEIEFWEDLLAPYTSEIPSYGRNDSDMVGTPQSKVDAYQQRNQEFYMANAMTIEEAEAMLAEKKLTYSRAKRAQEAEQLASVANPESKNYDPAFAEKSQYKSTATDAWHSGITTDFGMGYKDLTYEYINGDEDFRADVNAKHVAWSFAKGDTDSQYERAGYDHITEDEVALYNYYYNTSGKEKAEEYLDSIEEKLQTRLGVEKAGGVNDKLGGAYIFAVEAGLEQFTSGVKNMFSSEDYIPASATQVASGIVREGLADTGAKLPDWLGGASLGQAAYDVLNTTSNMLPSILTSAAVNTVAPGAGAVVGVGLMGTSAGGHAKAEMLNLGYSKEQANTYGIMVGAAEAGMEYLLGGITKLGGVLPDGITGKILSKVDNAIARTAIKIGGSMVSEGVEEGLQTVIDTWLKEAATGVDWDAPNVDEVLYSSLLGALSAFGLEGAGVVAGEVGTYSQGKTIRNTNGGVGKLQEIGSTFSADTVAYKIASKVNAQTDAYTIGRLLNEVNGTISEQNVIEIANGLMEKGMDSKTANKLARQYQTILNSDMNISDEAKAILNSIPGLNSVLRENLINKNTTVFQRTRAYSDLMNLADETANPKVDSLESLAQSMAARGVDSKYAGAMASGVKSQLTTGSSTKKVSSADADAMKRIASEVASGARSSVSDTIKRNMDSKSNIAASKLGVEGKYTSSETGATRLASNKKKVNIVGVDSIEGKTLKLKLDDGSIVDADEIDFSTADEALVYEAVTNMGVSANTAWEILKGYNPKSGQSGTIYAMGALEAYTYGHNGVKVDGMSQDGFSALLTPTQKNTANKLGDIDARAKVEAQQKTIDKAVKSVRDEAKSKHKAIPRRKGETVFEGDRASLTELQESQLNVLEKVAEGLGVTFHIFKSNKDANGKRYYKMPNGKITSANGWYDPKTGEIWIDLYAGNDGQGTMIFTAAHELTHFIRQWSPDKFKVFADFLFEQYGKKGQDVNQLIRNQISKAANNGRSISWDEAYEEVIADSCETFLRDSKAAEKIAALREKDIGLANKIKTFLGQMLAKMRKVMSDLGLAPDTDEGKMVAEMTDSIQKLYDLWTDALADAGEAYSLISMDENTDIIPVESAVKHSYRSLAEAAGFMAVENEDGTRSFVRDGVAVNEVTVEDIENSPIGAFINYSLEKGDIDKAHADRQKKMFADICTMACKTNDFSMTMQFMGSAVFTGMKANADKQYGTTYDFPSICTKTQAVIDAMSARMVKLGRGLNSDEIVQIYREVFASGNPVPCPECYVFSRWIGIGGLLDNIKKYQDYYGKMSTPEVAKAYREMHSKVEAFAEEQGISFGKAKGALTSKLTKEYNKLTEKIEKAENQGEIVKDSDRKRLAELEPMMNTVKSMTWLENVYFADSSLMRVNKNYKVPNEVLFDLNNGEAFATQYPEAWAFRTTQGAGYGKAITPYAEASLGEGILVTNNTTNAIKGKSKGTLNNYFLQQKGSMDANAKKTLDKARLKQKIQAFIGGQRFQSTSDARYENASDYLLAALEMQAMHGMVQVYTKVDGAVPAFSAWGFSINQSLMPLGGGLDADGNIIDTRVGGMNPKVAVENRKNHESAGTITIGVNDNHIRAMFADYIRDFIIPYHASGGKADVVAEFRRIQDIAEKRNMKVRSTDYSRTQSDKVLSDDVLRWLGKSDAEIEQIHNVREARIAILTRGKVDMDVVRGNRFLSALYDKLYGGEWDGVKLAKSKVESQIFPNEFWDQSVTYEESGKITRDYLEYCDDLGFLHRFSGVVPSNGMLVPINGYDQNGNRVQLTDLAYKHENGKKTDVVEDFFWKVLTDRRMYDNDGNYLAQKVVTLNDTTTDTVTNFARHNDGRQYNKKVSQETAERLANAKLSDRDSLGNEISAEQQKYFKDSKVRDKKGNLMVLYHGTTANFNTFKKGDVGFHFGTKGAARGRVGFSKNVTLKEVYLNITNPIVFDEDLGSWDADYRLTRELYDKGILTQAEVESVLLTDNRQYRRTTEAANKKLATVLLEKGYDGIAYSNTFETKKPTTSYIAFNSNQVKEITNRTPTANPDIRYSVREIVGDSGNNYGVGVYLDSNLLTDLTEDERVEMVKEYIKELGGSVFTAYDSNRNAVDVHIAEASQRFKNKSGKKVPVNKDLSNKNIKFKTKQESIALIDELMLTAKYDSKQPSLYSHDWLDNYGKNDWEYWVTYVQDKENTIWEATLNIVTSANGEKILYDINPIKMVEQSISLDTSTTDPIITHPDGVVNRETEKNSLRNVEPIETADYVKMYHHFGSTKNYDVAGYILGNGMMLDFSGKHWGDDYSTSRQVDHRDVQEVLGNRGSNNGVNAMIDMIGNGNIRLMPEVGGINLAVKPNATQMSQLRGYINHFKGEVEVDIDEVGGDTIHSFTYTRGTSSAKILADIKAYFDEGVVPKQKEEGETDIHQFLYSNRVTDKKTINFLENQEHITTYKSFVEIDGKLYSPMATQVKGEDGKYHLTNPSEIGVWQQAEEKPDSIPKFHKSGYGYYVLKKDDGGTVTAAYNPYEHSSNLVLNDQFEAAYQRPNLVTVECVIPKSEMTSGYKAKYAKDSTGYLDWKAGTVAGKMKGNKRKVYLSRWLKPVRILPDSEVAKMYKELLGTEISVPFNVVTPQLLAELEKAGVKIDYEGSPGYQYRQSKKVSTDDKKLSDRYSEGLSEADKEVADKVVKNLKQRAMISKYGIRHSGTYTAERMEREIATSSSDTIRDYAKSYITWVEPIDFIYATTASEQFREQLKEEAGDLDIEKLRNETQPIHLTVDFETGQIVGHEGRHRMLALQKSGIDRVAVIIDAWNDDRHNTKPIETMHIEGQRFGSYKKGTDFFLHDVLPLSQRYADVARQVFSFDGKDGVRFSDRSPEAVSTRSLLANALETTAQNDIERNKLELYKSKIDLIEKEQARLKEIKAELRKLDFPPKGTKKDTARIKDLRFEENETANRINTYDRQLLNLESTTALKNVLQREKDLVRKAAAQKNKLDVAEATLAGQMAQGRKDAEQLRRTKDAFAEYREKSEKTQREMADHYRSSIAKVRENAAKTQRALMDKNTESRKKAIESRNKTKMRDNIKTVVGDLKELLFTESKDKHVPIGLQKSVAEALDIINMDTMGADERVANYNDMIAKAKDPDIIAELTKSRDRIALQGENLSDKLTALKLAYAEIKNSDDPLIRDAHNEAIEDLIANTAEKVGNTSLRDMSYEQLEAVYDMYKAILATVRNANKLFKAEKQETITENSESVKKEVSAAGGHRDRVLKATKWLKKFGWNMLKPIYAMKLIGSDTLTRLYENVRKGEDTWAVDVNEAKDFFKETAKKYEYNVWDFEKQYKFADSAGHTFSLTLEQIMSLYAYSKRSQADKHLEFGGFIFDDSIEVTKKTKLGIPMKYEVNDANPYRLKKEDLAKIIDLLESQMPNVKGFVDEMQAYLSDVMGAKGNEVSLAMYDIKLYKEQNYFPLKTARYFREFDPEKNGTPKIKNSGFSKKTVPQAGNPIILSNFMDVWANHVNDMSMYHSFVLPLEDFMRVYNYSSTAGGYDSVQQYIKNAYGSQANAYIETLMNDLNGGARSDPATDIISKGMSLFKKAAVFASASVVIQQPSAIARAMAYIDAKYFVDKPEATKHKETWAEVKKYAPVAIIKEMGYFDTNMGRSTVDWIKEEKTWRDKVDDIASKAPALADELAWCAIWKAVKREVASTTKLTVGSEAYLKMVGKRFTEVVTKTQVYDSVLSRSALMRSKDSGAKMVTAFMAEPTTSLNMVVDAIIEGKRGNKKFAKQAVGAVAASIILNSILVSLVTAARDDDEDETYLEKYLESLTAEMLDGFNPLTYIPLVKDGWSIMQGFDIERSDMSIWSDLWQSVENLFSDNKSGFEKTEGIVGSIASIFGLPAKNLMRDARAVYNLASTLLSGTPTTWAGVGDAIGGAVKDSIPLYSRIEKFVGADESKADKLYDAIVSGDQKQIDRVKGQYKDDKAIESAIRQGLRENDSRIKEAAKAHNSGNVRSFNNYIETIASEGHFDKKMVESAIRAEESAFNTKISQAAEAKSKGDDEEYKKIVRELRDSYKGIYSQDEIVELIKKEQEKPKSESNTDVASSIYKASDVNSAFESGDTEMALEVIEDLFNTKVENYLAEAKKDAEENGKRFNERTAQKEAETKAKSSIRSSMTTYWKPLYKAAYKAKDTAEQERIKRILKDSGMYGNAREVIETIREWRTERD